MSQNLNNKLTPEIINNAVTFKCDCGGVIFTEKLFIKKLSALLSPSGNEEIIPIPVLICEECGKVPAILDQHNILPAEIKTNPIKI